MTLIATYYGSSGWLIELGDLRVLIDPWLKGTLSFPPGPWLIEGRLQKEMEIPEKIKAMPGQLRKSAKLHASQADVMQGFLDSSKYGFWIILGTIINLKL